MKTIELKKKTIVELSVLITEESNINKYAFCNSLIETIKKEFPKDKKYLHDFESFNNQNIIKEILRSCIENKIDKTYTILDSFSISVKIVKDENNKEFLNIELYILTPVTLSDKQENTITLSDKQENTHEKRFLHSLYKRLMSYLTKGDK